MANIRKLVGSALAVSLALTLANGTGAQVTDEGYRQIRLPSRPGPGDAIEERVLHDDDHVKLTTITLRRGTELPERAYPAATTIQTLHGSGALRFGDGTRVQIGPGRMLVLDAGKRHSVKPGVYGYLVLLVQHTKSARSALP